MDENRRIPLRRGLFSTTMGRITVYSQNHPRGFGLRVALLSAAFAVLVCALLFVPPLVAEGLDRTLLITAGGALAGALVLSAPGGLFSAWMVRRMARGRPVPPDADPARVWTAHWQITRGALHDDSEVNRLGRILADQSDTSRSPKLTLALGALLILVQLPNAVLHHDGSPLSLFTVFLLCVLAAMVAAVVPLTARRQRGVRRFRELYDQAVAEP
ncbi:hypothetical protein [Nocardiopsis quinghaiensis]|uniref:hypothetical protein n=1 Tax=Nocardiopsis quinghaiensis TaxID=464995 RepID=UPI00123B864E|nr:hypothetical protein [Nocardiopsis quinghaiensis]